MRLSTLAAIGALAAPQAMAATVTIGAILPLSGLFSTLGPPERDAIAMGVERVNQGGFRVGGTTYTMAVKVLDDESSAATVGIADYRQLVQVDQVPLLLLADNTRLYASMFSRFPLPVLNILDSTYPSILDVNPHVFLLRSDTPAYVPGGVWYARNVLHRSRIGFIGSAADPYSAGIETWVRKSADAYGMSLVADVNYPPGTTNFAPFIQSTMAARPDILYLGGVTQEVLPVAKQIYQLGIRDLPVMHNSGATPTQAEQIIGAPLEDAVMANSYDFAGSLPETSHDPATIAFYKAFLARYHEYPDDLTMWAFDAPAVIAAAMQRAGSVTDRDAILKSMLDQPVPSGTVSGWVPTAGGKLFHDRDAQTLSEGVRWCVGRKTIAPAFLYFMQGMNVTQPQVIADACRQ